MILLLLPSTIASTSLETESFFLLRNSNLVPYTLGLEINFPS